MTSLYSLPGELLSMIDRNLSCEDSINFKKSDTRIAHSLRNNLSHYDKMQISDDSAECKVTDSNRKVPPRVFDVKHVSTVVKNLPNLQEITAIIKDVNLCRDHRIPATSMTDCSPYTSGGYLTHLLGELTPSFLSLRQLSLHVDIMLESLENMLLPCPIEDLKYSLQKLANAKFNTFVQISICCAKYNPTDEMCRNVMMSGMQTALQASNEMGAKTEFVVEPCEGYVDMTVELGNVEYSFAFFYYNPSICDMTTDEVSPDDHLKPVGPWPIATVEDQTLRS